MKRLWRLLVALIPPLLVLWRTSRGNGNVEVADNAERPVDEDGNVSPKSTPPPSNRTGGGSR